MKQAILGMKDSKSKIPTARDLFETDKEFGPIE